MIAVVICAHGTLATEFINAAEMILGGQEQLEAVGILPEDGGRKIINDLTSAVKRSNSGDGVIIFTDMFGGTPTNIGCTLLEDSHVEVVTGINLPALIRVLNMRNKDKGLSEVAQEAAEYGRRHISVAGDLLRPKEEEETG